MSVKPKDCDAFMGRQNTVGPLLSGHPRDFENWLLNRGWPFNRGIEYCNLETLNNLGLLVRWRVFIVD